MNPAKNTIAELYHSPLAQLTRRASAVHAENFPKEEIQASSLLSIKTGGCPENCAYCPQSAHYKTGVEKSALLPKDEILSAARRAKDEGASRFCMGAAWREVKDGQDFDRVLDAVSGVASLGLEVCCTLGMLNENQAKRLKEAGLHFYNHNIDTSREHYEKIIQTRSFSDRIETIENVRRAGISVCTGGILGLGETHEDRIRFVQELMNLKPIPESITINMLVPFEGTPLAGQSLVDPLDVVRVISTLRILAPRSMIRLSAGRLSLTPEAQFLCFLAGANSIFLGEKLLTSPNPPANEDVSLMKKVGLKFQAPAVHAAHS